MWSKNNMVKTVSFGSTKNTSFYEKPPPQLLPPHKAGCEVLVYCKTPTSTKNLSLQVKGISKGETRWILPKSHMAQQGRDWTVKHQLLNMNCLTSSSKTTSRRCLPWAEGDWRSEQVKYFCPIISFSLIVSLNSLLIPSHKHEHLL